MIKEIHDQSTEILHSLYGGDAVFREGQYEAIEATLTHRRTLVVQKTGWGKSLVYFVCTKILRNQGKGVTMVVSPLLVLMENQFEAAQKLGLHCEIMNSTTKSDREEQIQKLKDGAVDIVLITPETLFSDEIQQVIGDISIGLFVVDEAHCISDWGHDFRLEYSRLNRVINNIPYNVPVLGTTATANDRVIDDLKKQFGDNVYVSRGSLMRKSLSIQILKLSSAAERYTWILENVPKLPGSGIIYCLTQRNCDNLADFLKQNGINALSYHSGLDKEKITYAEQAFRNNKIKVLVATIKLGMGYDKGDIAFVIHYQQPANIVAYYQQIGRAGRNIDRAYTFLMCGKEDSTIQDYFIETAFPTEEEARQVYSCVYANAESGIKAKEIEKFVNIRKNRIDKALMFLVNEGMAVREHFVYYPTLKSFRYNKEHYEAVRAVRRREQKNMKELTETSMCLSRFVVNCLDDMTEQNCGICQNCLGYAEFPSKPDKEAVKAAQQYLNSIIIPIEPRKQFPNKDFIGGVKIPQPNQAGICISKYGDQGYGMMVQEGKYGNPAGFCQQLIDKSARELRSVVENNRITAITCVPSLRSTIVPDFAEALAEKLGLPFKVLLKKSGTVQQKEMDNNYFQCDNAWRSFSLASEEDLSDEKIILVDDIVDSRWTLTVCGYLLSQAGCQFVFPFALASSSQNGGDQN